MSQWGQTVTSSVVTLFVAGVSIVSLNTLLPKQNNVKAAEFTLTPVRDSHSSTLSNVARIPRSTTQQVLEQNQNRNTSNISTTSTHWLAASFPVENFRAYTSAFGYRRSATGGSGWEFHGGLDIAAPQGSYVRNWWAGKVTKVADRNACGTHIVIRSGEWEHTYCHMEGHVENADGRRYLMDRSGGIQIWEGQQIPAGFRIGRVGMTGRTTGPHLHWGLKYANNYIDPAMVLREMFSQQQLARRSPQQWTSQQSQVIIDESRAIRDSGY